MNSDLIREFLLESVESLDRLDRGLIALETDPGNARTLDSVFRALHTIAGMCGFVSFGKLAAIAHVGESLLARMRDGELALNAAIGTVLLTLSDTIREMLVLIETTGVEGDRDYSSVVASLELLTAAEPRQLPDVPSVGPPDAASRSDGVSSAPAGLVDAGAAAAGHSEAGVSDSSLRIDVELLDQLDHLVSELVQVRNQIVQLTTTGTDVAVINAVAWLNRVTSDLEESVMKTRRQSVDTIWSRLPRLVRDLALQCGKRLRLEMEGQDTDLDKTIIEAIDDPLAHIVRNAVDHGIESPSLRIERGKPPEGVIRLRVVHESGRLTIEISDDGAGADLVRIKARAQERALLTAAQASQLSDADVLRLLFLPDFSTAGAISTISGRGVGLDVVKTNIEKIGGEVEIQSRLGVGTTLKFKIPLTMALPFGLRAKNGIRDCDQPQSGGSTGSHSRRLLEQSAPMKRAAPARLS